MHPIIAQFTIGGVTRPLTSYGLFAILGILAALAAVAALAPARRIVREEALSAAVLGICAGLVGAKLLFLAVSLPDILKDGLGPHLGNGGLVFYGGVAAGIPAAFLWLRHRRIPFWDFADAAAPALALGHAFGRVGCFLFGCCYGRPTDLPWGVTYPATLFFAGPPGVPLHPVQLYEAAFELFMAAVTALLLVRTGPRSSGPGGTGEPRWESGTVFAVWGLGYGLFRLAAELSWRGDDRGVGTGFCPPGAWISLLFILGAVTLAVRALRRRRIHPSE